MIEIKATVIGSTSTQKIQIKTQQGCASCHSGCGLGEVGRFLTRHHPTVTLTDQTACPMPGETVTLTLSETALLRASLWVYLMPAFLMVLGTALAPLIGGGNGGAIAGALGGLVLGLLLIRLVNQQTLRSSTPQLVTPSGENQHACSHQ